MVAFYRQPTGHDYSEAQDTKDVTVTWMVVDHATTFAVLSDANFPVAYNDVDPDDPTSGRKCSAIRVNATGFNVFSITATFSLPADGQEEHPPSASSTGNPMVYSWGTITESVAIDRDRDGNAITTSAQRSPASAPMKPMNCKRLTVTKWLDGYDLARAMEYENSVNSDAFSGAAAGEVMCESIQPSGSYVATALLVPIDHSFVFKAISIWGEHPHQLYIKDQDNYGIVGSVRHGFCDPDGNPLNDEPLDGNGRPVDTTVTYLNPVTGQPVSPAPTWYERTTPTGATIVDAGSIKFLRYMILPSKAFGGLGL